MIRPKQHLVTAKSMYPPFWKWADSLLSEKGKGLPDWPDWCYMPIAAAASFLIETEKQMSPLAQAQDAAQLTALYIWRATQGVYRFDPDLGKELLKTTVTGDLPCDLLYHLPEWGLYIESPGLEMLDFEVHGFFCHLEYDINTKGHELRFLIDTEQALLPIILHLGDWTLEEAINRMMIRSMAKTPFPDLMAAKSDEAKELFRQVAQQCISLLLYICSQPQDITGEAIKPQRFKTRRHGFRSFEPNSPHIREVGGKMGSALRAARAAEATEGGSGAVSPHIRRAHWHSFWKGPRDGERKLTAKWLPPIQVKMDGFDPDDLPTVIHPVD